MDVAHILKTDIFIQTLVRPLIFATCPTGNTNYKEHNDAYISLSHSAKKQKKVIKVICKPTATY